MLVVIIVLFPSLFWKNFRGVAEVIFHKYAVEKVPSEFLEYIEILINILR
jgi:hypothetical protein